MRVLVVGASGLGCKLLKDLALSGFRNLDVIDMDRIEVTNLNRQFFLRLEDVGKPKAEVAVRCVMERVSGVEIVPHFSPIEDKELDFYNDFNIIVLGLDSIEARRYINGVACGFFEYDEDDNPRSEKQEGHVVMSLLCKCELEIRQFLGMETLEQTIMYPSIQIIFMNLDESLGRQMSESSICATEEEEEDDDSKLQLGPQYTIKEHLEKDKDDESLRKWKEQLLGSVDVTNIGDSTFVSFMEFIELGSFICAETLDPEVNIISLAILSPGRPDIVLMVPENGNPKGMWFTLKEGSKYCLKFTFHVNNNIVNKIRDGGTGANQVF
ncbi:hypothetical protein IGI04_002708 [Brassica rapa subsp. trilocularis]|uniref:THIF-type NAD/FAD binding fold domain-containing protein n=1 Tax=Brassica rapa subsp. trilocularis TaxID=1813537 RepID=A0ABQ7NWA1_BRACM|nr:hypothetical protein IGI04_002708 [Brassica rapa subsp. trilocularis]